ncbi:Mpo1 family 2-hydroxy fatty acid dioxygenase [Ideonella dechloratans]|uniref:Mpo1 family 2-hydroxy fatty acid dioxygenase n=1 Tax=Ideonella dechloratans TaxID=36863 RepID=UPI0035ADCBB1
MATLFRPADELLVEYARFHRDRRNIHTHLVGIPLMVFGLAVLLSRPPLAATDWAGLRWVLTPAVLLWALSTPWYLSRGLLGLGLLVGAMHAVLVLAATPLAQAGTAVWLGWGLGPLLLGGLLHLAGHYYEGRAPGIVQDLIDLLAAPLFVAAELLFSLGWLGTLRQKVEREAGPTSVRDLTGPLTSKPGAGRRTPRPHQAGR